MASQPSMRRQQTEISQTPSGYIVDEKTGLLIPGPVAQSIGRGKDKIGGLIAQRLGEMGYHNIFNPGEGYYTHGYYLDRQESTLIPYYHQKGSIESELLLASIADGEVGNIGISPVVYPLLLGVLQSQISKAMNVTLTLTGKRTPVNNASQAISRFNDSPLGFSESIKQIVYGYRVFNRGQPIATVPIHWSLDEWGEWGMEAVALDEEKRQFYLNVNWEAQRELTPFLPEPLRCYPTGVGNWPYWYLHKDIDGKAAWVLLHKTHIIPVAPGKAIGANIGTSSLWQTLGFLSDYFLVLEHRAEQKLNKLASGLVGISGIDSEAEEVKAEMELAKEEQVKESRYFGAEYVLFTSEEKPIKFEFLPLRQGDGVENKLRKEEYEDALALAFGEPLSSIVSRGGMGLGSRMAETSSDDSADTGVNAIFAAIEHALECIFPRVETAISLPNNRAKRLNIDSFTEFAQGVSRLPEGTLSSNEVRAIIERDIFEIPSVDGDDSTMTTDGNDPIDDNEDSGQADDGDNEDSGQTDDNLERAKFWLTQEWTNDIVFRFEPFIPVGANEPIPAQESNAESIPDTKFDSNFNEDYGGMLSADNWDEDANPPDSVSEPRAEPAPGDNAWYWQLSLLEFLRRLSLRNVQRVDREESIEIRDNMATIAGADQAILAADLSIGVISLQSWAGSVKEIIEQDFTHAFLIGKGGRTNMTPDDWIWLNGLIAEKFVEVDELGDSIAQGLYSQAQVSNYTKNIVSGSVAAYEAANSTNWGFILGRIDLPALPALDTVCRGNCRCHWRFRRDGNIIYATWTLDPQAQHCISCLNFSEDYAPYVVNLDDQN